MLSLSAFVLFIIIVFHVIIYYSVVFVSLCLLHSSARMTMCLVGQTGDLFHEPALHSELSQDNDDVDAEDNDEDDDDGDKIVDEGDEDAEAEEEAGIASGDEEHVVETTLQSDDALVTALRQHSTTEYLPGMLHTNSPSGLLPKFPSWSILQLGEYSSYNPSTGSVIIIIIIIECICKAQNKWSSDALHHCTGIESFRFPCKCLN